MVSRRRIEVTKKYIRIGKIFCYNREDFVAECKRLKKIGFPITLNQIPIDYGHNAPDWLMKNLDGITSVRPNKIAKCKQS